MDLMTNTLSLTGKIIEIIQNANQELTMVSPYIQLDKWPQLMQALTLKFKEADKVKITFFIRQQEPNNALEALKPYSDKIKIFLVPDLHTKLYFNGKHALVTSMNLFQHSAEFNYEMGTYFEDAPNIEKIKNYLSYLRSAENIVEYQSQERIIKEEKTFNEKDDKNWIHDTFTVVSIGSKWVKVINSEGYENKFLIVAAPGLKEEILYEADVKRTWHRTPYGLQVEYTELKDVRKVSGHCIICNTEIELNPEAPMCKSCYYKNKQYRGNIFGKVCHRCGNSEKGITDQRPLCRECFHKTENSLLLL